MVHPHWLTTAVLPVLLSALPTYAGRNGYFDGTALCPSPCEDIQDFPGNWTAYHDLDRLNACEELVLAQFTIHTPLDDDTKTTSIYACTVNASSTIQSEQPETGPTPGSGDNDAELQISRFGLDSASNTLLSGSSTFQSLLRVDNVPSSGIIFAKEGDTSWGLYVGSQISDAFAAETIIQAFHEDDQPAQGKLVQVCGSGRNSEAIVGIVSYAGPLSLPFVQNVVATWADGSCSNTWEEDQPIGLETRSRATGETLSLRENYRPPHVPRADCRTIQVAAGDSCSSLARRCGISSSDYTRYNPARDHCSTLQPEQHVCCTSGTLPNRSPRPNPDGSCASYTVQSGDTCSALSGRYSLTMANIESFNRQTWGWNGCSNLQLGVSMCLSTGSPPMPAAVSNAICGPQMPGTERPPEGVSLASLNPCPLRACCNVWGQCGITPEYCVDTGTGPPGTARPGTNGCISNCGTDIVNNESPPASFMRIGYFEAFNGDRRCLHMDASSINETQYSHIHYGFGDITDDFRVDISRYQRQFDQFAGLSGIGKVISFGGWGFSTEPATYRILREGTSPANRERLATNIADFVYEHGLDGADIDWEYAGAPDIPGIPPGSEDEGENYLEFLRILRRRMPDKLLAIAAPASFWYLRAFPIEEMAEVLDYIVYMTYDLHGQWDYGSPWASPGCPNGDCLRSHVNMTETELALAMVTKAGVPSNKLVLGVSSYGRSFQMTAPGCTGPMCRFTGPASGATPGECTGTSGYLANAEINEIIRSNENVQSFRDSSDSNIMVYNTNQWVAYMDDAEKARRTSLYRSWNFGGTSDWAIDLQQATPPRLPSTSDPNVPHSNGYINPYIKGCSDEQASQIVQAWHDAATIADAHWEWSPRGKWQGAMDIYMGRGSAGESPIFGQPTNRYAQIKRQWTLYNSGWASSPAFTYLYFTCDTNRETRACRQGNVTAHPKSDVRWWRPSVKQYVTFCPLWFSGMTSLAAKVDEANGDIERQRYVSRWWRANQARSMYHETMHFNFTVGNPPIRDYRKTYWPERVAELARTDETNAARNSENYALAALAIYMQKTFNRDEPPQPRDGTGVSDIDPGLDSDFPDYIYPDDLTPEVLADAESFPPSNNSGDVFRMTDYGSNIPPRNYQCLDGDRFGEEDQCNHFCRDGTCSAIDDGDWWECDCEGGVCNEGLYADSDECRLNCHQGLCNISAEGARCQDCP